MTHTGGFGASIPSPSAELGQNGRFTSAGSNEMATFAIFLFLIALYFISGNAHRAPENVKLANENERENNNFDRDYYD